MGCYVDALTKSYIYIVACSYCLSPPTHSILDTHKKGYIYMTLIYGGSMYIYFTIMLSRDVKGGKKWVGGGENRRRCILSWGVYV